MKNTKNIDSIRKSNKFLVKHPAKFLNMDGVVKREIRQVKSRKQKIKPAFIVPFKKESNNAKKFIFFQKLYSKRQVSIVAALVALFLAFGGGMWVTLSTTKTAADNNQPQVLGDSTDVPAGSMTMPGIEAPPANSTSVSNDILFNTPIQQLQNYFADVSQPDIIANRTALLTKFLNDRHSPFASAAATIANQSHWDLILAIAFAESTLGKNCTDNNCSNIGVGPTSPLWHKYNSYQDWVVSFNRLLDKRYNNWTLEQMCGVYVKPCNPNWLMATKEILADLKDRGIE